MAVLVLRLVLLGALAAAANDVPVVWSGERAWLPCALPEAGRSVPRPPPPPLVADDSYRPYAWLYEGQAIAAERIAANGSLEVSRGRDGEGRYQCLAKLHGGYVLGYPVQLKFASISEVFSVSPEDTTVQAGQPAVFRCDIESGPPAEVSWLKNDAPVSDDDRHYNIQNHLVILGVTEEDAGFYSCAATNEYLRKRRRSEAARLSVGPAAVGLAPAPLALQLDAAPTVARGGQVTLACPVASSPPSEMVWQFTPPGGRTAELAATEQVIVLTRVEVDEGGVYTCAVEGQGSVIRKFNLTVTESPVVVLPPESKNAPRASTVRFNCTAAGQPQPGITWYKNGIKLEYTGQARMLKSFDDSNGTGDRMELVVSGITSDDAGIYQCFASNGFAVASSWASLNVTGETAAAPAAVACRPAGPRAVALRWTQPPHGTVVAYTIQVTPEVPVGQPIDVTNATVKVAEPFRPYGFQVRAYFNLNARSGASDNSETVYCSGQGAPLRLTKLPKNRVLVSWRQIAVQTADVLEWRLQQRPDGHPAADRETTLPGDTHNYTLDVSSGHVSVRVLGTKSLPWLEQDLSLLAWSSTAQARDRRHNGDSDAIPTDLVVSNVTVSSFTVTWRCEEADAALDYHTYYVCIKRTATNDKYSCHESFTNIYTAEELTGDTQYSVKVQARAASLPRGGPFTTPVVTRTLKPEPSRFAHVRPMYVNGTTALLRWGGPARAQYVVRQLGELLVPMEVWRARTVEGPEVYIALSPVNKTYVMVSTRDEPVVNSNVFTLYSQNSNELAKELLKNKNNDVEIDPTDVEDVRHEYTSDGLTVWWGGPPGARYRVRFSQDLVAEMEAWRGEYVDKPQIQLRGLDTSLPTYLQVRLVRPEGPGPRPEVPVYTLPPAPSPPSSVYLGIGVGVAVCLLCLLLLAALFIWRRRKRRQSPSRARRRNLSSNKSGGDEGSEMTTVGGRLANGGALRGAGEPLLNGHVHIIENPTVTKTPNGKKKSRGRFDAAAFDVSRNDAETTAETTLEADLSAPYDYLDTSRRPGDASSPRDISADNSFSKLPDDNMNSELTRSTDYLQKDNSKVQPTLQPNG